MRYLPNYACELARHDHTTENNFSNPTRGLLFFSVSCTEHAICTGAPAREPESGTTHPYSNFLFHRRCSPRSFPQHGVVHVLSERPIHENCIPSETGGTS